MENVLGLLKIKIVRGINLAIRDIHTSDPYVSLKLGNQRLKTRVIKSNIHPEWNEDLTLSVMDPELPVKLTVYDYDTLSKDDKMGEAEFDMKPFIQAMRMELEGLENGSVVTRIPPSRANCFAEESCIVWSHGRVTQTMCLRLNNVECGEVEIQLQWVNVPGCKGIF